MIQSPLQFEAPVTARGPGFEKKYTYPGMGDFTLNSPDRLSDSGVGSETSGKTRPFFRRFEHIVRLCSEKWRKKGPLYRRRSRVILSPTDYRPAFLTARHAPASHEVRRPIGNAGRRNGWGEAILSTYAPEINNEYRSPKRTSVTADTETKAVHEKSPRTQKTTPVAPRGNRHS